MRRRNSVRQRREQAQNMDPWETDEEGRFARDKPVVDPISVLGLVPIIGVLYALTMIFSGNTIDGWQTGVSQRAIRSGHVGLVAQAIWLIVFLITAVVV